MLNTEDNVILNNESVNILSNYSKYPVVLRGLPSYKSGQITSLIGNMSSTTGLYINDTIAKKDELIACLTNGVEKLLKTPKGDIFKIATHTPSYIVNDKAKELISTITFSWVETGTVEDIALYDEVT